MFFLKDLTHTILLHPVYFGPQMETLLRQKLHKDVEGTCSGRFGYIIAVVRIDDETMGRGKVLPNSGLAEFTVHYKAIVFKPFKGEVVDAIVASVNKVCSIPSFTDPGLPCRWASLLM